MSAGVHSTRTARNRPRLPKDGRQAVSNIFTEHNGMIQYFYYLNCCNASIRECIPMKIVQAASNWPVIYLFCSNIPYKEMVDTLQYFRYSFCPINLALGIQIGLQSTFLII